MGRTNKESEGSDRSYLPLVISPGIEPGREFIRNIFIVQWERARLGSEACAGGILQLSSHFIVRYFRRYLGLMGGWV